MSIQIYTFGFRSNVFIRRHLFTDWSWFALVTSSSLNFEKNHDVKVINSIANLTFTSFAFCSLRFNCRRCWGCGCGWCWCAIKVGDSKLKHSRFHSFKRCARETRSRAMCVKNGFFLLFFRTARPLNSMTTGEGETECYSLLDKVFFFSVSFFLCVQTAFISI